MCDTYMDINVIWFSLDERKATYTHVRM